jgi:hypothetical protein
VTQAGRSVFCDLFPAEKAAEMEMRTQLLMGFKLRTVLAKALKYFLTPRVLLTISAACF